MGLLKKRFTKYIIIIFLLFISGCSKSLIQITAQKDSNPISMYGENPQRNFFTNVQLGDSLRLLWENSAHGSFNNSSFMFYDSTVFVHDLGGRIYSFNIYNGKQTGVLKNKGSIVSSPLLFNYVMVVPLIVSSENLTELIFYDFYKGKELNNIEIEGRVTNQLLKINDNIVAITEDGSVIRFDNSGKEIWSTKLNSFIHSNPAFSNNKIYFGTDDGLFYSINYSDGKIDYKKKISGSFKGGVTIKDNLAFTANDGGDLFSINISNGEVIWKVSLDGIILMNPALDDKDVFIGTTNGELYSINQKDGKINWISDSAEVYNSTPLVTANKIVIADLFRSYKIIDKFSGKLFSEIEVEGRAKLTPAIKNNILFIGFDNGTVRAYEIIN